jgi:hypothetical protein
VEKLARERGLRGEPLRVLREQGAAPVLQRLHTYMVKIQAELLPKSEAGQAVACILKNWTALTRYSLDADLAIPNNHTERSDGWERRCGRANPFHRTNLWDRRMGQFRTARTQCPHSSLFATDLAQFVGDLLASESFEHPQLHDALQGRVDGSQPVQNLVYLDERMLQVGKRAGQIRQLSFSARFESGRA